MNEKFMNENDFEDKYEEFWGFETSPLDIFEDNLKEIVEKISILQIARICDISIRKKSCASYWEKIDRYKENLSTVLVESENLLSMEDSLGGKIIVLNICDLKFVTEIAKIYLTDFLKWKFRKEKNYIEKPTPQGHRAYHLYFQREFEGKNVYAELQILTEPADFWARWSHFLNYKGIDVESPTRIEEKMFMTFSKRLEIVDDETNEMRLELEYFRPAYPKKILGKLPEDFSISEKPQFSRISTLTPNLKWLAVYPNKLTSEKLFLGFDEKKIFGFHSSKFKIEKKLVRKDFDECAEKMGLSAEIRDSSFSVLERIYELKKNEGDRFFNGILARLDAFKADENSLSLWLSRTSYWTLMLTNLALDRNLKNVAGVDCGDLNEKLLEQLNNDRTNKLISPNSILANNLAVHVTLKTSDDKLVITQRGKMGTQSELWSNTASGDLAPCKWEKSQRGDFIPLTKKDRTALSENGVICQYIVSPFLGAARELAEEIGIFVPMKDFRLQSLILTGEHLQPILLFEVKTKLTFDEIINSSPIARDRWELTGGIKAVSATNDGLNSLKHGFDNVPGIISHLEKWQEKAVAGLLLSFPDEAWN